MPKAMKSLHAPDDALLSRLADLLGPKGFSSDPEVLAPWLRDWRGRYQGAAAAMLSPASTAEVSAIVKLAAEARVALVPQGGNTGMVAGATPSASGDALLLSMRRMRTIRSISASDNIAIVEAGVILSELHSAADAIGRRFPLSLGAKGSATIGGLISTNAGGTQVLRFGPMRAQIFGIEAVLPDGSIFKGLTALRKDNRGYDLRQLLAGAEGTLGVVTAASLRLVPAITGRAVAWVGLARPQIALRLLRRLESILGDAIESFELVPREALDLVLRHIPGTRAPIGSSHDWNILIEMVGSGRVGDPMSLLQAALETAADEDLLDDATLAVNETQADAFWHLRDSISEAERIEGFAQKHDVSVAVSAMPDFLENARDTVRRTLPGIRVIAFGHLGDGNIHFNLRPPAEADGAQWIVEHGAAATAFVHDLVTSAGGSLSAEHGIGQAKLAEFSRLIDPVRLATMRAIKDALDPHGIMNPGKLVPLAPVIKTP